jgi:hypothetical protein
MGSGTIIRIILIIGCIFGPLAAAYYSDMHYIWLELLNIVLVPLIQMWDDACDCEDCILSNCCSKTKRYNFVKKIMIFVGYNADKINSIPFPKNYECENTYKSIYSYIKNKYNECTD